MSQAIPDGAVSDPDLGAAAPGTGDDGAGSSNGAPADGNGYVDPFAGEREKLEAQNRRLQGDRDRLAAELSRTKKPEQVPQPDSQGGLTLADLRVEMRRAAELQTSVSSLREQFPYANPDIFARVDSFDSVEQFAQAVGDSHQHVAAMINPAIEAGVAKVRADYEAKYGPLVTAGSPGGSQEGTPEGLPQSVAAYQALSWSEKDKLDRDHPGILDRLTAQALQ